MSRAIILASASPRRKEILEKTGLRFTIEESGCEENALSAPYPQELAESVAREKARSVAAGHRKSLVIAADTIVVLGERIFGKPGSSEEAREMLAALNGQAHSVITGFTIIDAETGKELTRSVETKVFFRRMSTEEIDAYVNSGEPLDKAGAYGIQGLGAVLIERIEGDYFNVVGLPLSELVESLKAFGVRVLG